MLLSNNKCKTSSRNTTSFFVKVALSVIRLVTSISQKIYKYINM
jgi:hypothetical protein